MEPFVFYVFSRLRVADGTTLPAVRSVGTDTLSPRAALWALEARLSRGSASARPSACPAGAHAGLGAAGQAGARVRGSLTRHLRLEVPQGQTESLGMYVHLFNVWSDGNMSLH